MFKNVTSQKIALFAYDSTTGAPKTGDSANITPYVSKDYGTVTVLGTTTATEMDATNAKGWYSFVLTQAETNGDALLFSAKSSTANAFLVGQLIFTDPASFTSFVTPTNLTAAQIATGIWQDTTAGDFTTALSVGKSVMNGVSLGTGLTVAAVSGAVGSVTGFTASNLDATISSRMATYTQPTGFLAATFPSGTVANTTNITSITGNITGNLIGTVSTLTTYTGNTPQTGDNYARLGAPAGASVSADVAAVKVDTAAVKVQTDKLAFTVTNKVDANVLNLNGDATSAANIAKTTRAIVRGTVSSATSTSSFTSTFTPTGTVNDQWKGRIVTFDANTTTAALQGQATDITAYTQATGVLTVTALTTQPVSTDTFSIT